MKRGKKLAALLAGCAVLLTGCAGKPAEQAEPKKPVQLTALQYEIENMAVDFDSLWFYQRLEEQTGVHVDFSDVKDSEWTSSVALTFARGNMPDLILRGSLDVEE